MKAKDLTHLTNQEIRNCYKNSSKFPVPKIVSEFIESAKDEHGRYNKHDRVCRLLDRIVVSRFIKGELN